MRRSLFAVAWIVLILGDSHEVLLRNIRFCGGGETLKWVEATPCLEEPCAFEKPTWIHLKFAMAASKPTETLRLQAFAEINGSNLSLPGLPNDLCKLTTCPLHGANDVRQMNFSLPIKSFYPSNNYTVAFYAFGDNGLEFCGRTDMRIL